MGNRPQNIFQNRKLVNRIMYGLAIVMVLAMVLFTFGPALFGNQ